MKFADAPPAGWYPDPQNRTRLRWWDGLDWTDIRRAPPSDAELASFEAMQEEMREQARAASGQIPTGVPQMPQGADTQQVIRQVRSAARDHDANEQKDEERIGTLHDGLPVRWNSGLL